MSRNILLVETGGKYVLIDAGQGHLDPDDPGLLLNTLGVKRQLELPPHEMRNEVCLIR
ncbi:MAG: hypothetical protein H0X37_27510 [Herpetosiphonaceae bacterium]|nr:hypothetical protein [Herpetosiphonaceae bacterium]